MQNDYLRKEDMLSLVSHKWSIDKYVVLKKIIIFFLCFDCLIWTWTWLRLEPLWTRSWLGLDSSGLGLDKGGIDYSPIIKYQSTRKKTFTKTPEQCASEMTMWLNSFHSNHIIFHDFKHALEIWRVHKWTFLYTPENLSQRIIWTWSQHIFLEVQIKSKTTVKEEVVSLVSLKKKMFDLCFE